MGRRLVAKSFRVNDAGEMLANFAADRIDGLQVSREFIPDTVCIPFGSTDPPLADRKHLVITFPIERVNIDGTSPVTIQTTYQAPGAGRNANGTGGGNLSQYSTRKQFLRGQYLHLSLFSSVQVCANSLNIESVAGLETS